MAMRDEPSTRQTNQTCYSNAGFHKCYCISYLSICTAIDRSAARMHYYYNKIFLMKQKVHPEFHSGILEFNFSSRPIYLNVPYTGKFWQLKELANYELFAKFSLPIFIINYSYGSSKFSCVWYNIS